MKKVIENIKEDIKVALKKRNSCEKNSEAYAYYDGQVCAFYTAIVEIKRLTDED